MKIKEICKFQNGFAFKSKDFVKNGKYKVIKIKELKDGLIKFSSDTSMIKDIEDNQKKYFVKKNDILFALTGDPVSKNNPLTWVGRISKYTYEENALLNQRVCKIIPDEDKLYSDYLYYYFRVFENFYNLAQVATGSASQANISTAQIGEVDIPLPPLEIQRKIVNILGKIDEKIELNKKINHHLVA